MGVFGAYWFFKGGTWLIWYIADAFTRKKGITGDEAAGIGFIMVIPFVLLLILCLVVAFLIKKGMDALIIDKEDNLEA